MLAEDRVLMFYETSMHTDFFFEDEEKKEGFITRLINRIKDLIEKIKKFINEKILKKKSPEVVKEVEVDQGIWNKIKSGLKATKAFLSKKFKDGKGFFKEHKGIAAACIAVIGITVLSDLGNGKAVKVRREILQSTIKETQSQLDEMEDTTEWLKKMNAGLKKPFFDKDLYDEDYANKVKELGKSIIKTLKRAESELPKYGSILYRIGAWLQKVTAYLAGLLPGKKKDENK